MSERWVRAKVWLARLLLVASIAGFVASLPPWRLIAPEEPLIVLLLSWGALIYTALADLSASETHRDVKDDG